MPDGVAVVGFRAGEPWAAPLLLAERSPVRHGCLGSRPVSAQRQCVVDRLALAVEIGQIKFALGKKCSQKNVATANLTITCAGVKPPRLLRTSLRQ